MRPLEFGWYLPTHGDTTAYGLVEAQIPGSPELCDRVVQAAEAAGFEYLLIPVGSVCWEAWITGAFMAARPESALQPVHTPWCRHAWADTSRIRADASTNPLKEHGGAAQLLIKREFTGCIRRHNQLGDGTGGARDRAGSPHFGPNNRSR